MYYDHEWKERVNENRPAYPMPSRGDAATDEAARYISHRDLSPDLAFVNGWYGSQEAGDSYRRVVIPALNTKGSPYWQARALAEIAGPRYQSPSSPRHDSIVIVLPFIGEAIKLPLVIAEGPFDALAAAECNYVAVGLMGNNPPTVVWDHIFTRYCKRPVIVVADADGVGQAVRWQAQLAVRGMKSKLAVPVGVKDLAAMPKDQRVSLLNQC